MLERPYTSDEAASGANPQDYARLLRRIDLFAEIDPLTLAELAARLQVLSYSAPSIIFRQGERGEDFYLVASGIVGIYRNNGLSTAETQMALLQPGEAFGVVARLHTSQRTGSIRAETDCVVLRLAASDFLELVRARPGVAAWRRRRVAIMKLRPARRRPRARPVRSPDVRYPQTAAAC